MSNSRQISFKIEGAEIKKQSVPFRLLANVLDGIQKTFYSIGLEVTGRTARSHGRVPADIQQACELRRIAEKQGSFAVVAEVADISQMQLFNVDLGIAALNKFMKLIAFLEGNPAYKDAQSIFPDSVHRRRILRSVEKYCPRKGDEWALTFDDTAMHKGSTLNYNAHQRIRQSLDLPNVEMLTVTGELMRLHLDEHKISILYPPTQRILDCFYDVEIEDFIIDNLRDMVQVTGRVQLDALGHPDKIIDAASINELNLATVKLCNISALNMTLDLTQPLIIEPRFAEQEFVLEYPNFHIIATGFTREDAINTFEEDFVWLWKEYGIADDNELSPDARQLKKALAMLVKE